MRQGDVLGTLTVTQNGETVLEVPIRAAETVEKLTFGQDAAAPGPDHVLLRVILGGS